MQLWARPKVQQHFAARAFSSIKSGAFPLEQTKTIQRLTKSGIKHYNKDWASDMHSFCKYHDLGEQATKSLIKMAETSPNMRQTGKLEWRVRHLQKLLPDNTITRKRLQKQKPTISSKELGIDSNSL